MVVDELSRRTMEGEEAHNCHQKYNYSKHEMATCINSVINNANKQDQENVQCIFFMCVSTNCL